MARSGKCGKPVDGRYKVNQKSGVGEDE